jgi:Tfp pilus assembly protein PilO
MTRLIITFIGFVLAGGVFFWYTKPAYDNVQTTRIQIAQYDAALNKAAELQKLKQSLLSRFNAFRPEDLDRLHKLLPDHVDNVRLILDLDNLAGRYGLSLQNVDVSSSQSQSEKKQTAVGAIGASNQKYDSLTLSFGTRATYANFVEFLKDLEASLRIVDLISLSITPDSSGAVSASPTGKGPIVSEPQYGYKITLRTYWLK